MRMTILSVLAAASLWHGTIACAQPAVAETLPIDATTSAHAPAEPAAPPGDRTVLRIGPQQWSARSFASLLAAVGAPPQLDTATLQTVIDTLAEQRLLARRAEATGLGADPLVAEKLALARDKILADEEREQLWKQAPVDDAAVRAAFEAHPGDYDELQLSQILVRTHDAASPATRRNAAQALALTQSIRRQWAAGASFSALARKYSEDEASQADGGRLPTIFARDLRPEVVSAIAALKPQQVSAPVKADDGYHLIRLDERTLATFEARRQLLALEQQKLWVNDQIRQLRESAPVGFDAAAWLAERDRVSVRH